LSLQASPPRCPTSGFTPFGLNELASDLALQQIATGWAWPLIVNARFVWSRWLLAGLSSDVRKYDASTLNRESRGINYRGVDPRASRPAVCVLRRAGLRLSNRVPHGPESCVN